ncbi:MAG: hypothetical protein PWQ42_221 [Sulfurospirillum sp.]|jgi:DNA-binding transcriptional regulator WhiA|nr:hypothetical protein [Sulfurospirillum sp.]DAB33034.1 MAG TPA: hypothetical protein CFH79_00685 [Sulfurospirillum sp. UBA11407]
MKKLSELQDFFYEQIYPHIGYLEEERLKIFSFLRTLGISLFILSIVAFLFLKEYMVDLNSLFVLLAVPVGIFMLVYSYQVKTFQRSFKDEVIQKLVSFVSPKLFYSKDSSISRLEYDSSFLFPSSIDKFNGDDLIKGEIDGVSIKFSELHTQKKKKSSKGQTYYVNIFKGLLFIADFNKHFKGRTIVMPDKSERLIGGFSHFFQSLSGHGELIKLDNPEFEREFVVYGSDQIEARYILSHSLMQNILELKKLIKEDISLSFSGSKIYLAVHKTSSSFEPRIYKKVDSFDEIKLYFQTISLVVEVVKILNLDIKIWSKK